MSSLTLSSSCPQVFTRQMAQLGHVVLFFLVAPLEVTGPGFVSIRKENADTQGDAHYPSWVESPQCPTVPAVFCLPGTWTAFPVNQVCIPGTVRAFLYGEKQSVHSSTECYLISPPRAASWRGKTFKHNWTLNPLWLKIWNFNASQLHPVKSCVNWEKQRLSFSQVVFLGENTDFLHPWDKLRHTYAHAHSKACVTRDTSWFLFPKIYIVEVLFNILGNNDLWKPNSDFWFFLYFFLINLWK